MLPVVLLLSALGTSIAVVAWRDTRGTTLRQPSAWVLIALLSLATGELALARLQWAGGPAGAVRYLFSVTTLCPMMALLGAKRPQHRGWQFIVVSLWVISALPALQSLVYASAGQFTLPLAWRWFLAAIIGTGLLNYVATRYALAALASAVGQGMLYLSWTGRVTGPTGTLLGLSAIDVGLLLALWIARRPRREGVGWNRVWREFRDHYGVVWGLRAMERINQAAVSFDWPDRLTWQGFARDPAAPQPTWMAAHRLELDQTFRTVLRRFVDADWIAEREEPSHKT